ncbi:MAG: arginine--tRNA ligase [Pirellulales bacterium]
MNVLSLLSARLKSACSQFVPADDLPDEFVRASQEPRFGDYQANFAMALGKKLNRPPRDLAADVVARMDVSDCCEPPEVAGPGFINFRLQNDWLASQIQQLVADPRLGVQPADAPRTYVIDYSAPNVAKPMHVGHIRSTVIGDALYRTLSFLGHRVIGDNHIGDWGTQFGMIIYGYKHFLDSGKYQSSAVAELARLYRLVNRLVDYFESRDGRPKLAAKLSAAEAESSRLPTAEIPADAKAAKQAAKARDKAAASVTEIKKQLAALDDKLAQCEGDAAFSKLIAAHPTIGSDVLAETASLHAGDAENRKLWQEFLPPCLEDIDRIYQRLGVKFDHTLGESFYHEELGPVVHDLLDRGIAQHTEGAVGVFVEGFPNPFLIRKRDGAFLYGTTDLATITYRMKEWQPNAILYVVDHRQGDHFQQLFATARRCGYEQVELQHVAFGTVMGPDGKPYKTRSGDTVGLEGLIDEAVERALQIVSDNDDAKPDGGDLSAADRQAVAGIVGIGALKYADLAHSRTTDYVFSYEKMLAMNGNTATYMQYAYARVQSIFRRGKVSVEALRNSGAAISLDHPAERALAIEILRLPEALDQVIVDYRPNHLTDYLWRLANAYSSFFEHCPVLKAETPALRDSRLLLCDLNARVLKQGLALLGIGVVEQM